MSDTELNILDVKKILLAQDLYKPGMTIIEMNEVYYSFKCKQAIEAEGLYENGMSDQDIKVIYKTLKRSVESAGKDKEYREILNLTETNCTDIDMLVEKSDINNDETIDVTSIQSVSPKPQSASKSFSSFLKKRVEKQPLKNLNVLIEVESNHPMLKLRKMDYSSASLIYYHQTRILKLPLKERANVISQYLLTLDKYHKNNSNNKVQWSSPIQPHKKKQFNGDLCVDFIPDAPEENQEETMDSFQIEEPESSVKDNSYMSTRPKRLVKRKMYVDQLTDDEDDFTAIKKTKSTDNLNIENISETKSVWIKKKKKAASKVTSYFSNSSSRTDKIFDQLKCGDSSNSKSEKSTAETLQDTMDLSDSDEEIAPSLDSVTIANIHKEEEDDPIVNSKNGKTTKVKRTSPRKRSAYNKLSVQKNSATKENESPEISTQNFYAKNKNLFDVDESNNNKLDKNEDITNCPICSKPFPASKIEEHASNCIQYEGHDSETFCDICNEHISDKKLSNHRYECLRKITEASVVVDKPVTRSQRSNGFLCHVCDKYICNTSEIQHASNCIAKV